MLRQTENHRAIRIPCIPFGSLEITAAGGFLQLILGIDRTIFGSSAFRTPAAMRNAVFYGPIQTSAISAGCPPHTLRVICSQLGCPPVPSTE